MKKTAKPKPVTLSLKAKASKSRKLSVAEKDLVLDELAKGRRPKETADWLRRATGTAVTLHLIASYLRTHADEIAKRRRAWSAGALDQMHLRYRGARVGELIAAYALLVRQCFREMCPTCAGSGLVAVGKKDNVTTGRCAGCKGRRWVVSKDADAYTLGDDVGASARRLMGMAVPPDFPLSVWDRMQSILKQIGEEVGDTKAERSASVEDLEAVSKATLRQAYAKALEQMTPEQRVEVMMRLGGARPAFPPEAGKEET